MSLQQTPNELVLLIAQHLDLEELLSWSLTSTRFSLLLKRQLCATAADRDERKCWKPGWFRLPDYFYRAARHNQTDVSKFILEYRLRNYTDGGRRMVFLKKLLSDLCDSTVDFGDAVGTIIATDGLKVTLDLDGIGHTVMHRAAIRGNLPFAKRLIGAGANVDVRTNPRRQTPLHLAAGMGWVELTEFLLESGADPVAVTSTMYTPLDCVDNHQVMKCLLDTGSYNGCGKRPCLTSALVAVCAGEKDPTDIARLLLELGARPTFQDLCNACDKNHIEVVRLLVGAGVDAGGRDEDGGIVFHHARSLEVAHILQKVAPANIMNVTCNDGKTALLLLYARRGLTSVPLMHLANFLVENGCDAMLPAGAEGKTILHYAASCGHADVVENILNKRAPGCWVNKRTVDGRAALHLAASAHDGNKVGCIRRLVGHGADIQIIDRSGANVLHYLFMDAKYGQCQAPMTQYLVHIGVDASVQSSVYGSALIMALHKGDCASALLLIDAGTDLSATVSHLRYPSRYGYSVGMTALHVACKKEYYRIVERLLQPDVSDAIDVDAQTEDGDTALHIAMREFLLHYSCPDVYFAMIEEILLHQEPTQRIEETKSWAGWSAFKTANECDWGATVLLLYRCNRVRCSLSNNQGVIPTDLLLGHYWNRQAQRYSYSFSEMSSDRLNRVKRGIQELYDPRSAKTVHAL